MSVPSSALLDVRWALQKTLFDDSRLIVWFSCGAASACALYLLKDLNPLSVYCDVSKAEHSDNMRFMADVEAWTGIKTTIIKSSKYETVEQVWDDKRYMAGMDGAPCTVAMKKVPRFAFQRPADVHVFGFVTDEKSKDRVPRFMAENFDLNIALPLITAGMSKVDCLNMVRNAGIRIPTMYELGFENNNCIGCVKATSPHYWNRVRKYFPAVFQSRAEQSRRIGARLCRLKGVRIFLDELPENATEVVKEDLSCGPQCVGDQTSNGFS